jgi:hypothetical protein
MFHNVLENPKVIQKLKQIEFYILEPDEMLRRQIEGLSDEHIEMLCVEYVNAVGESGCPARDSAIAISSLLRVRHHERAQAKLMELAIQSRDLAVLELALYHFVKTKTFIHL